jgi:hypothetical protein
MKFETDVEQQKINSYVRHNQTRISRLVEQSLAAGGIKVSQQGDGVLTVATGCNKGLIDLENAMHDIASTASNPGKFDSQLHNPAYEHLKITSVLGPRLRVIKAVFGIATEPERIQRICELSQELQNLSIQFISEEEPETGKPNS